MAATYLFSRRDVFSDGSQEVATALSKYSTKAAPLGEMLGWGGRGVLCPQSGLGLGQTLRALFLSLGCYRATKCLHTGLTRVPTCKPIGHDRDTGSQTAYVAEHFAVEVHPKWITCPSGRYMGSDASQPLECLRPP